jgi:hypothetical protein
LAALFPPGTAHADVCLEPNDGPENACYLPNGAVIQGSIDWEGDVDAYKIEVAVAGTRVRVELTDLPADYDLYLIAANGDVLGQSVKEGTEPETLELTLQAAGTYYLYVRSDPGRPFDPNTPYTLAATFVSVPPAPLAAPQPVGPPAPAPVAVAEPWIGDIMFGYNESGAGAVPSGATIKLQENSRLWYFMSYRGLRPGSQIVIKRYFGKDFAFESEHSPPEPSGKLRGTVLTLGPRPGGGATLRFSDVSVEFHVDGKQLARGYVLFEAT